MLASFIHTNFLIIRYTRMINDYFQEGYLAPYIKQITVIVYIPSVHIGLRPIFKKTSIMFTSPHKMWGTFSNYNTYSVQKLHGECVCAM